MLHVWLSEEKTRKLPHKHNWDYSPGLWDSQSLCSVKPKTAWKHLLIQKPSGKECLFFTFSHAFMTAFMLFTATLCCFFLTCKLLWQTYCWLFKWLHRTGSGSRVGFAVYKTHISTWIIPRGSGSTLATLWSSLTLDTSMTWGNCFENEPKWPPLE